MADEEMDFQPHFDYRRVLWIPRKRGNATDNLMGIYENIMEYKHSDIWVCLKMRKSPTKNWSC
jgi:hypothetical protein